MKDKNKKIIIGILGILIVLSVIAMIYLTININDKPSSKPQSTTSPDTTVEKDYSKEKEEYITNKAINDDYVGMIRFESGLINLPFVQSHKENIADAYDEYLRLTWDSKEYDEEGSIFLDPTNKLDDQNIVIYGHYVYPSHDITRTHMFTPLHKLKDEKNYQNNKYINLVLENEIRRYEIAHVYYAVLFLDNPSQPIEKGMEYMFTNFTDENLEYYLNRVSEEEFYDTNVEINNGDRFLTLQTCVENHDELRLIVIAKEVEVIDINE